MRKFNRGLIAAATVGALAGVTPAAQAEEGTGFYLGAGASAARLKNAEISDNDVGTGDLSDFDDDRVTWKAHGGYMLTPWLGAEASYIDLGKYKENGFKVDGNGKTAAAVLALPLSGRNALYAKGGRVWWDVDAEGPLGFDADTDGEDWFYGAGVRVGLLPAVDLRLEYERYELKGQDTKADLDLATIALQFHF